eukprot:CAMPEP_0181112780 /NCGR_PEP_ID=MMETSP1071-20121207/19994_1 /TAXON_ID=35127 /ORGANISM="Thalassiosira sp., Strain NH16" /LENGTH=42 /DNA_ID= /DNA_START= /DNA_END= /DNA_ORIENTATION=
MTMLPCNDEPALLVMRGNHFKAATKDAKAAKIESSGKTKSLI